MESGGYARSQTWFDFRRTRRTTLASTPSSMNSIASPTKGDAELASLLSEHIDALYHTSALTPKFLQSLNRHNVTTIPVGAERAAAWRRRARARRRPRVLRGRRRGRRAARGAGAAPRY